MLSLIGFAAGALLLFVPLWRWRAKASLLGSFDQRVWPQGVNRSLACVDVVRAAAGSWLLAGGLASLSREVGLRWWQGEGLLAVILGLAVLAQVLAWHHEDYVAAPIFYVSGLLFGLLHPLVTGPALILAVGTAIACRAWAAGFLAASVAIGGLGFLFAQQRWSVAVVGAVVCSTPVLLSVLLGRQLGWLRKPLGTQDPLRG